MPQSTAHRANGRVRRLVFVALLLATACYLLPVRLGVVCGESMSPTLHSGQVFLMRRARRHWRPKRGDIVVLNMQGETEIKRVYAVGGDTIRGIDWPETEGRPDYIADGHYASKIPRVIRRRPAIGRLVTVTVPAGYVFVLGDARNRSYDSRQFGPVPLRAVSGRLIAPVPAAPRNMPLYQTAMASEAGPKSALRQ